MKHFLAEVGLIEVEVEFADNDEGELWRKSLNNSEEGLEVENYTFLDFLLPPFDAIFFSILDEVEE